ncbi:TniQ family protein [Mariprofundus aestuarium]|uniref:TniQ family protein n=1 Tax=Mariprofundus aestuarium TaxID=1921086 RepID=UPI0012FE263B|nr:TniQ family protein [Mariprofundus aestuarium]
MAVHLAPLPDELLSSWVHRTCHANATSLYSLLWHHGLKCHAQVDLDQCKNRKLLLWLARELKHPEGVRGVRDMSLLPVLEIEKGFPHRSWIRGIDRRAFKWRAFRYCPVCLSEDERPYFRQHWRLDWYEVCHHHQMQMFNACPFCGHPLILHRVRWHRPHLAHCYSCYADLRNTPNMAAILDLSSMKAIEGLILIINHHDKKTYAAVHFVEAFLDQWIRLEGIDSFAAEMDKFGYTLNDDAYKRLPLLMRAVTAYRLWHEKRKLLKSLSTANQNYFNLAVRSFGCPKPMEPFFKALHHPIEINKGIILCAIQEIEATGREATVKRISKKLGCSPGRIDDWLS